MPNHRVPGSKPVHVVLDVRTVHAGALDGVGRHWWLTLAALPAHVDAGDWRVTLVARADSADAIRAHTRGAFAIVPSALPIASLAQQIEWPRLVSSLAPDVVTYPQYDMPRVPHGIASVATIYDFTPLDEPAYFGPGRAHRRLVASALTSSTAARATRLTTLAEAIAREIARRFPAAASRVRVLPPGPVSLSASPSRSPSPPQPSGAKARFVYVGNHRPHKRVPLLLDAFTRLHRERGGDVELVLAGRVDARFADVAARARATPGVVLMEAPSDADVAAVVAGARALLFASVGEGFGFPVVEAQSLGTPAIVADAGSLPEVVAGGGVVVSPAGDVDAWVNALKRLLDDGERARLSAQARAARAARSWDTTAGTLVAIWREAFDERKNGRT